MKATDGGARSQEPVDDASGSRKDRKRVEANLRNALYRDTRKWTERLAEVEEEIMLLEETLKEMERAQNDPQFYEDKAGLQVYYAEQAKQREILKNLYGEWETLGQQIEERENRYRAELEQALGTSAEEG